MVQLHKPTWLRAMLWSCGALAWLAPRVLAQEAVTAAETGFAVKRPVLASACPHGCPWGELGDYVKEAMEPLGYDVVLCRNCNRDLGPRLVSNASRPPELGAQDTFVGTTTRVDAPVDFGITESGFLSWAYAGRYSYQEDGPMTNLRLIAKIEDPTYLMAAVKADSSITDLRQIAEQHIAVRILGGGTPISERVLEHYGLTSEAVTSWGGSFTNPIIAGAVGGSALDADVIINELASPANNPESSAWTAVSQRDALRFLDFDAELLDALAKDESLGLTRVTARWGLLRGVDRPIDTVARSGHAIFARDDMPDEAAYDAAKAIEDHRSALKWFIRPYAYDSQSVWSNGDVPLHPGAARYYRERGYLAKQASGDAAVAPADAGNCAPNDAAGSAGAHIGGDGGCCVSARGRAAGGTIGWFAALLAASFAVRSRRRGQRG